MAVTQVAAAFWSAPVLWRFRTSPGPRKAPEGWTTPERKALANAHILLGAAKSFRIAIDGSSITITTMDTLESLKQQILALPKDEMLQLQEWFSLYLEDQAELNPEFVASIERGKAELDAR